MFKDMSDDAAGIGAAAAFPIHADEVAPRGVFITAFKLAYGITHLLDELVHLQHAAHGMDEAETVFCALLAQQELFRDVDGVQGVVVGFKVAQEVLCGLDVGHW